MTIRTFLAVTALVAAFSLTGCAAKTQYTAPAPIGSETAGAASAGLKSTKASSPDSAMTTETVSEAPISDASLQPGDRAKGPGAGNELNGSGLDTVYFDFDAYLLTAPARETVSHNAGLLGANGARISLEGHTDERGSDEYNLALAEQRAVAVKRYLNSLGIPEERLEVVSYGEDKPAESGAGEAVWAKNRRVEFVIIK